MEQHQQFVFFPISQLSGWNVNPDDTPLDLRALIFQLVNIGAFGQGYLWFENFPLSGREKNKQEEKKENIFILWIKSWRWGKKPEQGFLQLLEIFLGCCGQIGLLAEKGRKNQSSATFEFGINPTYQKSGEQ